MIHIPKPLAILLKEKGYKEDCCAYYRVSYGAVPNDKVYYAVIDNELCFNQKFTISIPAPTHQEVCDFLREKHNIIVYVNKYWILGLDEYIGYIEKEDESIETDPISDYYEAYNKAIETALTLI